MPLSILPLFHAGDVEGKTNHARQNMKTVSLSDCHWSSHQSVAEVADNKLTQPVQQRQTSETSGRGPCYAILALI